MLELCDELAFACFVDDDFVKIYLGIGLLFAFFPFSHRLILPSYAQKVTSPFLKLQRLFISPCFFPPFDFFLVYTNIIENLIKC